MAPTIPFPSNIDEPGARQEPTTWAPAAVLRRSRWVRFGVSGSAVWLLAVLAALVTGDRILLGTVVLLGSFVVPLTWVMRTVERDPPRHLSLPRVFHTFVYGGVAGLLVSAVLETWLL